MKILLFLLFIPLFSLSQNCKYINIYENKIVVHKTCFLYFFCKEKIDTIKTLLRVDTICENSSYSEFGISSLGYNKTKPILDQTGIKLVRTNVFFENEYKNNNIDNYISNGFLVNINFNWKPTNTKITFCKDTLLIRNRIENFCKYYYNVRNKIVFVSIENEWDNTFYRDFTKTNILDYLKELKITTDILHAYGFKVSDAGISGNTLYKFYNNQLSVSQKSEIIKYCNEVIKIPIDYLNLHWYNKNGCNSGLTNASKFYMQLCNKKDFVINEFGVHSSNNWNCIVDEIKYISPQYAFAYSGDGSKEAINLTIEMLKYLNAKN